MYFVTLKLLYIIISIIKFNNLCLIIFPGEESSDKDIVNNVEAMEDGASNDKTDDDALENSSKIEESSDNIVANNVEAMDHKASYTVDKVNADALDNSSQIDDGI